MHVVLATVVGLTFAATGLLGAHDTASNAALVATPPTISSTATILL
jgi:hypothetical protein